MEFLFLGGRIMQINSVIEKLHSRGRLPTMSENDDWEFYKPLVEAVSDVDSITLEEAKKLIEILPLDGGNDYYGFVYELIRLIATAPKVYEYIQTIVKNHPNDFWINCLLLSNRDV
jgi:hypothetical protein